MQDAQQLTQRRAMMARRVKETLGKAKKAQGAIRKTRAQAMKTAKEKFEKVTAMSHEAFEKDMEKAYAAYEKTLTDAQKQASTLMKQTLAKIDEAKMQHLRSSLKK